MRPLFIGQLLPFTAKPIRASRLKNINLRNFTTFIMPYTSLSIPVVLPYKKLFRGHAHSVCSLATPLAPVNWYLRHTSTCSPALAISLSKKFFHRPCPDFYLCILDRQRSHLLHKYLTKCLFVALPTPLPAIPGSCDPPKARHFASGNKSSTYYCTKFNHSTKQENFDAPPSQMIPCIPCPADSFDSPYNISGFATVSVRPRQDRARGKIHRGNCVRDRTEKKSTVQYITSRHI